MKEINDIKIHNSILTTNPLFPKKIIKTITKNEGKWFVVLKELINIYFIDAYKKIDIQEPKDIIKFVNKHLHNIKLKTLPPKIITIENDYLIFHHKNEDVQMGEIIGDKNFVSLWVSEINEINNQLVKLKQFYEQNDLFANFEENLNSVSNLNQ